MTPENLYGTLSIVLAAVGSGHYFIQMICGKVKPHFFTYLIWTVVTLIVLAGLVSEGVGPASWRTAFLSVLLAVAAIMSLRNGIGYIRAFDVGCLLLSLLAIPIWMATHNPDASIVWLLVIEVLGAFPTFRKAWHAPFEEGAAGIALNAASYLFCLLALSKSSVAIELYFGVWAVTLAALAMVIMYRRHAIYPELTVKTA